MTETITVVGNITEPEYKTTDNGLQILNFRIASTERRFDKAEEKWVEGATNWYSVSAFRQLADHASRSFRKGDRIFVTGRLRVRDWETAAKKGVTAQIDADALGHDLRWGTTTFHRDSSGQATGAPVRDAAWAVDPSEASGWPTTIPGEAGDVDEGAEPVLVGAASGAASDAPF